MGILTYPIPATHLLQAILLLPCVLQPSAPLPRDLHEWQTLAQQNKPLHTIGCSPIKAVRESSVTCALPDKCGIPSQPHCFGSTFFRLLSTLFRLFCHVLAFFNHHSHSRGTYMNGKCSPNRTCYYTHISCFPQSKLFTNLVTCTLPDKCGIPSQLHSLGSTSFAYYASLDLSNS